MEPIKVKWKYEGSPEEGGTLGYVVCPKCGHRTFATQVKDVGKNGIQKCQFCGAPLAESESDSDDKWGGTIIPRFNGLESSGIYVGGMTQLFRVNLPRSLWNRNEEIDEETGIDGDGDTLTLNEISAYVGAHKDEYPLQTKVITVIVEGPMRGDIYQYGNHGDYWEHYGETRGYA